MSGGLLDSLNKSNHLTTLYQVHIPLYLSKYQEIFTTFYKSKYSGRKLQWQTNIGNADLKATFNARKHEINVATYEAGRARASRGADRSPAARAAARARESPRAGSCGPPRS